jgi:hypothetical protein
MKRIKFKRSWLFSMTSLVGSIFIVATMASAQHKHAPTAPDSSPTPTPTPMAMPSPGATPTPSTESVPGTTTPHATPTPTPSNASMPGMAGANSDDHNSLTVMHGDEMLLRVGQGRNNFLSMNQMGSGTAWQPATSAMFMWQQTKGPWLLMYHGELKLGVNAQTGSRGVTKFESQNWFMPMAMRQSGPGTLQLKAMFSLEPFTFSPGGSPQLFQNGETYKGLPSRDHQHPHDLFMTLSSTYSVPIGDRATWFGYLGMPGEPALGPVAFMHRASASENPSAPLSHHLQDSTHISYGVATTGFTYRWFQIEGSVFNGREPDEKRYGIEFHPWNSRSVRFSVAPSKNWTAQWSYGWLHEPESAEPGNVRRMTASISYNQKFAGGSWATSLIWGRNLLIQDGEDPIRRNGYLAETTVNVKDRNYLYSRIELTDKGDLLDSDEIARLGFAGGTHPNFRIAAFTIGGVRDIWTAGPIRVGIGADATFYQVPRILNSLYGDRPSGFHFFLRLRPGRMSAESHMEMPPPSSSRPN